MVEIKKNEVELYETDQVTNERGGSQTGITVAPRLLPPRCLLAVAHILFTGAKKYGVNNWKKISPEDNFDHALRHIEMFKIAGKQTDLDQAICRLMFMSELLKEANENPTQR